MSPPAFLSIPLPTLSSRRRARCCPRMVAPRTVIVGAGPAGLATAFFLHEQGADVTIIERSPDPTIADPNRAFSYLVSKRGQRTMQRLGLMDALKAESTSSALNILNIFEPSGQVKRSGFAAGVIEKLKKTGSPGYWLARSTFVRIMLEHVRTQTDVQIILGAAVTDVRFDSPDGATVHVEHAEDARAETLSAELVVGCDGMHSAVRRALVDSNGKVTSANGFELDKWDSPAVGLPYKILVLGPQPLLPAFDKHAPPAALNGDTPLQRAKPTESYVFRGALRGREALRIGLLPVGTGTFVTRSGNIIMPEDRALWSARDADAAYELLSKNFPCLDAHSLVERREMERFVKAPLARFPPIQRSRSLVGKARGAGVALLGDAAHAFPPDIGQGVNSALEDALLLCEAMKGEDDVGSALSVYENMRDEDVSALMRLMQLGNPYQYRQSAIGYNFVRANTDLRFWLNKLAPGLFSPQVFVAVIDDVPYKDILRRVNETTMRIYALGGALVAISIGMANLLA